MQRTASEPANPPQGERPGGQLKPPVVQPGSGNNIIVNPCQRGNPILECVKNVGKEFGDIVADYQVGRTTGVLFLSFKYHRLHPEYIHQRIERMGTSYNLRILLIVCDVSEHQDSIRELTKTCLINNITVIVCWTPEEAGFYLSTFKQFEHRPPTLIKERVDKDYHSMLRTALTSINKVNKTDVEILRTSIGSFADIAQASSAQLLQLPGFGQVKVKRIKDAFDKPFRGGGGTAGASTLPFASHPPAPPKPKRADKGKQRADAPRPPSPTWDIELDLDATPPPAQEPQSRKRPPSPVWDIELDLNDSDVEDAARTGKRHKPDEGPDEEDEFGAADLLQ